MFFTLTDDVASGSSSGSSIGGTYTYYVDPIGGNDANNGSSTTAAWLTTSPADSVVLTGTQTIGYLLSGTWYLYRKLNMTFDEALLAANLVTETANNF